MLRFMNVLAVVGVVGGCVTTTGSPTGGGDVPVAKLQAENKSIVIVHTSLHDQQGLARCDTITAALAQRDEAGQFMVSQRVTLKAPFDLKQIPSRVELPAGNYGIVSLNCQGYRRNSTYNAKLLQPGSPREGREAIFEKPFAEFQVRPGEVVDIGSLRLPSRETQRPMFGPRQAVFVPVVTTIPDLWLKNLAEDDPKLYEARVQRPMKAAIRI
jgi:hypothetical protein